MLNFALMWSCAVLCAMVCKTSHYCSANYCFTVHCFVTYCTAVQFLALQFSAAFCIKEGLQCKASLPSLATAAVPPAVARHQPNHPLLLDQHATKLRESKQQCDKKETRYNLHRINEHLYKRVTRQVANQSRVPSCEVWLLQTKLESFLCVSCISLDFLAFLLPGLNRMETPFLSFFARQTKNQSHTVINFDTNDVY